MADVPFGLITTASRFPVGVFCVVFTLATIRSSSMLTIVTVVCEPPEQKDVQSKRTCVPELKPVPVIVTVVVLNVGILAGVALKMVSGRGRTSTDCAAVVFVPPLPSETVSVME